MLKKYYLFFDYLHYLKYRMKKNLIALLGKQLSTDDFFTLRLGEYQKNHAD
jgi:hypothetical protein